MKMQSRLTFFPTGFADESLFSLIARYHRLSGNIDDRDTLHELFGNHTHVVTSHLPTHLDALASVLPQGLDITVTDFIERHTVFPYFRPFLTASQVARCLPTMKGNSGTGLKTMMGMIASQVGGYNSYRYCLSCAEADIDNGGQAYWHRTHQLPAVLVCPTHGSVLMRLEASWVAQHRHRLFLPSDPEVVKNSKQGVLSNKETLRLLSLSRLSQKILESGLAPISATQIQQVYRDLAVNLGAISVNGRLRISEFSALIQQNLQDLPKQDELIHLFVVSEEPPAWALRLMRKIRCSIHPLKHLILLQALNGKFEHLANWSPRPFQCIEKVDDQSASVASSESNLSQSLRTMLNQKNYSLRRCAQHLGLSVTTLRVEAERLGISIGKRPKKLNDSKVAALLIALESTSPFEDIAEKYECSTVSLYRLLRMHPDVAIKRQHLIFDHERKVRRSRFSVGHTRAHARDLPDYIWLYRHDRLWLLQAIGNSPQKSNVRNSRINWAERDAVLAEVVSRHSQMLYALEKPVRVTKSSIGCSIGNLAALEKHLAKLPLTAAMLNSQVETIEQFQCRRLQWAKLQLSARQVYVRRWQLIRLAGLKPPFSSAVLAFLNTTEN
ncbi:TnsD family Tn7-like transposition protein [Undibacterium sp. SXout11W]|uniref:TnsD family Tn7-like transposition protein n=1 Tax=Undibacterium sp. SXout11W TaxID=3413050 RepID=UPI003BF30ECB